MIAVMDMDQNEAVLFVRLPEDLKHSFRLYAISIRQSMSTIIRNLILDILEELGYPEDLEEFQKNLKELMKRK